MKKQYFPGFWQVCIAVVAIFLAVAGCGGKTERDNSDVVAKNERGCAGLWMYFRYSSADHLDPRWIKIFDDGEFFENMAIGAFDQFNRDNSKADEGTYWGVFQQEGDQCILFRPGMSEYLRFKLENENKIVLLNTTGAGYRVKNLDGLRLNGFWTSAVGNPHMDFLKKVDPGSLF